MRIRLTMAALALVLGACSETTWRHDTTREVAIDGRALVVSWIRMQPGELDIVVSDADGRTPVDAATAAHAAQLLGSQHGWLDGARCDDRFALAPRYGAVAQTRYSFRCTAAGK